MTDNDNETEQETEANAVQDEHAKTLGLARWVQGAYMANGLFLFWLLDNVITVGWSYVAEPEPTVISGIAVVLAVGLSAYLWKHALVNRLTHEVIGELAKVTWPTRKETTTSAVVVVITSVIAAMILGGFDAVWSTITDIIYEA